MQSDWQSDTKLKHLVSDLVSDLHPRAVYLFGSHARGDARADSDYDLFVVVDDDTPRELWNPRRLYRWAYKNDIMADVIGCRHGRFELLRRQPGSLSYEVQTDGVALYERH